MSTSFGDSVTLTATFAQMSTVVTKMKELTVRNAPGNSLMYTGTPEGATTAVLQGGEWQTFHNVRPIHIYVKGTASDVAYWSGSRA